MINIFKVGDYVRVVDFSSPRYGHRGPVVEVGTHYAQVQFGSVVRGVMSPDTLTLIDTEAVLHANAHRGLIDQIKEFRSATGAGLREAKDAVEAFRNRPSASMTACVTAKVPFDKPLRKHWFIAVLNKDNEPQPNSPPKLYTSAEQARAVAYSMAEKHRGETFAVYEATDVVLAPHVRLPETQSHKL